jgi:predicted nuclease of restriction endonuclease-like (RecB) superfamily
MSVRLSKTHPARLGYAAVLADVVGVIEQSRSVVSRTVNAVMTATYWRIGRRIVETDQRGRARAAYGAVLIEKLSVDLTSKFGRGFSRQNLQQMRQFYLSYRSGSGPRAGAIRQTPSGEFRGDAEVVFPLPWSHYVQLLSLRSDEARQFYETEALRGGWTVLQLARQIDTQFYERTALSRNKAAMLRKGSAALASDMVSPQEELRSPYVLEFLDLKDEYSESDLEEALVTRLEKFLLELGDDFAFIGRQRRLRLDDQWYRVDLVFFHRRLRCLVVVDLKLGAFTHADAGQMHLYLNYAREHWTKPGENPPVGLILCANKRQAVARYALDGLPNQILAAEYRTTLPDERRIAAELENTREALEGRVATTRSRHVGTRNRS